MLQHIAACCNMLQHVARFACHTSRSPRLDSKATAHTSHPPGALLAHTREHHAGGALNRYYLVRFIPPEQRSWRYYLVRFIPRGWRSTLPPWPGVGPAGAAPSLGPAGGGGMLLVCSWLRSPCSTPYLPHHPPAQVLLQALACRHRGPAMLLSTRAQHVPLIPGLQACGPSHPAWAGPGPGLLGSRVWGLVSTWGVGRGVKGQGHRGANGVCGAGGHRGAAWLATARLGLQEHLRNLQHDWDDWEGRMGYAGRLGGRSQAHRGAGGARPAARGPRTPADHAESPRGPRAWQAPDTRP
jgi:hypothetical protein